MRAYDRPGLWRLRPPQEVRAFLERISPLNQAARIRAPLWFMLARNEGHGFRKRDNMLALRAAEADFIRFCLARAAA